MTSGQYHETVEDLRVKVLGGSVRADRTWYEGAWHFNRRWAPLKLHYGIDGSLDRIERNFALYERVDDAGTMYAYARRRTILVTDTGYRWQDRYGNWIEYDEQGRMTTYGDRNNVQVSVAYDEDGNLTSVFDHFGTQVLWYELDTEGRVTSVRDETNRHVEYQYTNGLLTTVVDVRGNSWQYQYDEHGRLSNKIDPLGRETTVTYNVSGMVSGIHDQEGIGTAYEYADDGVRDLFYIQTRTTGGRIDEYWYDREGHQVRHDLNGRTIATMTIDGRRQIRTDRFRNETVLVYDDWNNNIEIVYPDRASVARTYDPTFSSVTRSVNENGVVTEYVYDTHGNLTSMTEAVDTPVERRTEYEYDEHGQQTLEKRVADDVTAEAVTHLAYDARGNLISRIDPEGHTTAYTYDNQGNALTRTDPRGKLWTYAYDATGNLLTESSPISDQTTRYEYDAVGNLVTETNAAGNPTSYAYDVRDHVIRRTDSYGNARTYTYSPDGYLIQENDEEDKPNWYVYDVEGRLVKTIDGNRNETSIEYVEKDRTALLTRTVFPTYRRESMFDERGRLIEQTLILSDDTRLTTVFEYDLVGNQTTAADANERITRFQYDSLDRIVRINDPMGNTVVSSFDSRDNLLTRTNQNGNTYAYAYDRNDRLVRETWPQGENTSYGYDATGNMIEKFDGKDQKTRLIYDDASRQVNTLYFDSIDASEPEKTVTFSYDSLNNLRSYDDGITSASYEYDDLQRITDEIVDYGMFSLGYSYEYFQNGQKKSFIGPDARRYEYHYDNINQLDSVLIPGFGSIEFSDSVWMRPGRVSWPGGSSREYQYDGLMRVTRITDKDNFDNVLMDLRYTFDEVGNVVTIATVSRAYAYSYDSLDRVIMADSLRGTETFVYDEAGNRVSDNNSSSLWEYNENSQLVNRGNNTYTYDANGSLITIDNMDQTELYVYDVQNRLIEIRREDGTTLAEYYYDPFGRRGWKDVDGVRTYFFYSAEGVIGEFDANGAQLKAYGYLPDFEWSTAPLFQMAGGEYYFYHNDDLGTPHLISVPGGAETWRAQYSVYGEAEISVSAVDSNFRFPGQYFDRESGLSYNFYRYYDPGVGRYTQSDPLFGPGHWDVYAYASDNPVSNTDPFGLRGRREGHSTCGKAVEALLQKRVKQTCNQKRKCRDVPYGDCATLNRNIGRNMACYTARRVLNVTCFGGGGPRHRAEEAEALLSALYCAIRAAIECRPEGPGGAYCVDPNLVPDPIRNPQPERDWNQNPGGRRPDIEPMPIIPPTGYPVPIDMPPVLIGPGSIGPSLPIW